VNEPDALVTLMNTVLCIYYLANGNQVIVVVVLVFFY